MLDTDTLAMSTWRRKMFNIAISEDTADTLFREILMQDYKSLKKTIRELESNDSRMPFEDEDLEHDRKYLAATEVLMEYYVGFGWKKAVGDE